METEIKTNSFDRYLLCNYSFSDKMIDRVKADIKAFIADREKDDKYFEFIDWKKTENCGPFIMTTRIKHLKKR